MSEMDARAVVKHAIETRGFVTNEDSTIISRGHVRNKESSWLMDLRAITLDSMVLEASAKLFWEQFKDIPNIQIGGMESGAIPLIAGFVAHAKQVGRRAHTSGFYIRKSRKKDGLLKVVEGTLDKDATIVLVDDLVNSGESLIRQVEVLKDAGVKVHAIWTLLRFRDAAYYEYFHACGIEIHAVFSLDDFSDTLGIRNITNIVPPQTERYSPWGIIWRYSSARPSYQYVVPKSDLALDATRVYVGSDAGIFRALSQETGEVEWQYSAGSFGQGKGIFSSPALLDGTVFFGAYNGNVYALNALTGEKKWEYADADWVGSSPTLAPELGLLFIGLEFGLWRKRGSIAALRIETGELVWQHSMPCYTHSSPLYIPEHSQVVIGSNDGAVYLLNAKTGVLAWKFSRGEITQRELDTGFGDKDIKESFAYDPARDLILFGAMDGSCIALERRTGLERHIFRAEFGICSTPVIYNDTVIFTSLDKHVYCLNLDTFALTWTWQARARIFAPPTIIDDVLFVGSNAGRLTELDPSTGQPLRYFVVSERITNRVAHNPRTGRYFLPTFANEVYCLERPLKYS